MNDFWLGLFSRNIRSCCFWSSLVVWSCVLRRCSSFRVEFRSRSFRNVCFCRRCLLLFSPVRFYSKRTKRITTATSFSSPSNNVLPRASILINPPSSNVKLLLLSLLLRINFQLSFSQISSHVRSAEWRHRKRWEYWTEGERLRRSKIEQKKRVIKQSITPKTKDRDTRGNNGYLEEDRGKKQTRTRTTQAVVWTSKQTEQNRTHTQSQKCQRDRELDR